MTLDEFENALKSLYGWPTLIGVIGGEPTMHPQFEGICALVKKYHDPCKYGIFTAGGKRYEQHKCLILDTFKNGIRLNEHTEQARAICLHQPLTVAIYDAVPDEEVRVKLIDNCWVQKTWCPTIAKTGAFFCEIAYGIDTMFSLGGGYPIEPGWWKRTPADYKDQVDKYCNLCGMPIPMKREVQNIKREKFSPTMLKMAIERNLPRLTPDYIELFNKKFTKEELQAELEVWDPGNYRQDRGIPDRKRQNWIQL
jgi:hypothetical protein